MKLTEALLAARKAMRDPRLKGDNPHFSSKFVPRDEVLDVVLGACMGEGIFLSQGVFDGALITNVFMGDETAVLCRYPIADSDNPQKYMAALTYASRGSLMLAFALAGEPDDDGNTAATPPPEPKPEEHPIKALIAQAKENGTGAALAKALGLKAGAKAEEYVWAWDQGDDALKVAARLAAGMGAEAAK